MLTILYPPPPISLILKSIYVQIGLGLAVALIVCLFPMPYGYYTLVRFVAMIIFGCMAFSFYKNENISLCVIAGVAFPITLF